MRAEQLQPGLRVESLSNGNVYRLVEDTGRENWTVVWVNKQWKDQPAGEIPTYCLIESFAPVCETCWGEKEDRASASASCPDCRGEGVIR